MIIKILFWLFIILLAGILILAAAIIHKIRVWKQFINQAQLEEYTDNEEWLN